ncbi:MAG: hypothetical protein M3O25_03325 [Actinomycetota bacterium]|nr:hypothetical protein [Actinomycetota bacterium]
MVSKRLPTAVAALACLVLAALGLGLAACGEKEEPDLSSATTAPEPRAAEVAGDWTGQLTQKGLAPFQVAVRIEPAGSGTVAYTGINCGGVWALGPVRPAEGSTVPRFFFRETIQSGAGGSCKGNGSVTITPAGGSLSYEFVGGRAESRGTLTSTDAAGLAPVFQQAGLPAPG